jgi:hypothetical protein
MSKELRRRLQEVDPNLKIVSGRRPFKAKEAMESVPRVLSPEEAQQWGLPEMMPIFASEEILAIEARWSKIDLQSMAVEYHLDSVGDKSLLVRKLLYIGALDKEGNRTELPEPAQVPYVIGAPKKFCCRLCGACAPEDLLKEGLFLDRMTWLRRHYKEAHPGVWGKRQLMSVPAVSAKFPLGQTVMTSGVASKVATDLAFAAFALESLRRHASGDWGDLSEDDKRENEYALGKYLRLFSAYEKKGMPKIWIITEADRSVTTTLFPEEY